MGDVGRLCHVILKQAHLVIQVKREKTRDPVPGSSTDDGWLSMTLSEKILGHVGMELVSECYNSTFLPNVLGIVFVRTKVRENTK